MTDTTPTPNPHAELIATMRRASVAVYIAVEEVVADDLSDMLTRAADALDAHPQPTAIRVAGYLSPVEVVERERAAAERAWDDGYIAVPAEDREWFVEDAPNPYRLTDIPKETRP